MLIREKSTIGGIIEDLEILGEVQIDITVMGAPFHHESMMILLIEVVFLVCRLWLTIKVVIYDRWFALVSFER